MKLFQGTAYVTNVQSGNFQARRSRAELRKSGTLYVEDDEGVVLVVPHIDVSLFQVGQRVWIDADVLTDD